jgi:lipopolysaccharide biosynthesis glycosyltransferase
MPNIKFTFATKNYERYAASLKYQVPDVMIETIDTEGLSFSEILEKAIKCKMSVPDYFNDGDKVIFIDNDVIVNKNLDSLFDKVNKDTPICFQKKGDIFNSGLYVILINNKTRDVSKRAMELFLKPTIQKSIADEIYLHKAINELGVKVNYRDCLQSFETTIDPNCYVNHFMGINKQCETYQNFLNKMLKN